MNPPDQPTPERPITSLNAEEAERLVDQMWKGASTPDYIPRERLHELIEEVTPTPDLAPTPRTQAARLEAEYKYHRLYPGSRNYPVDHTRMEDLEREPSAAQAECERLRDSNNALTMTQEESDEVNGCKIASLEAELVKQADACARLRAEVERLTKAAVPLCIGAPIIGILAREGRYLSGDGQGLVAADDLFRKDPFDRAEKAESQLHALRLVAGTTDADRFTTWLDREIAKRKEVEAERDALAKDKVRLDWLENQGLCFRNADVLTDKVGSWIIGHDTEWAYKDARKMIDAAMKGTQ